MRGRSQQVDLDAALFDVGMDWDGSALDTYLFDTEFSADGAPCFPLT